ncbi:MAG: trypsin-like peptidase domain-containing protein [Firmicutes bacterium]|nr:trypsin-like peptidase domain-containing protein [Bacillota bacterium]
MGEGMGMEARNRHERTGFSDSGENVMPGSEEHRRSIHLNDKGTGDIGLGRKLIGIMLAVGLIGAVVGGLIVAYALPYVYGSSPRAVFSGPRPQQTTTASKEIIKVSELTTPAAAVAKKLGPSVVNVSVNQGPRDAIHSGVMNGVGSGVIYTSDGYIITNNHVIEGANEIFVTIGSDEVRAKLVAADPETDLAIIKVDKTGLPAAEFGSTKDIEVGDPTIAIGNPYGFEHTVTSGIISALNRNVTVPNERGGGSTTYTDLVQTDAAINPGNSGGALSDAKGRVIGINTLIISDTGANEGIGFAIPVETVKKVADELINKGKASHPYIGIQGGNAADLLAAGNNVKTNAKEGVLVVQVLPGGPAEKAGLQKNDIIIAVNGSPIKDMDALIAAIRQKDVGNSIEITYIRNGQEGKVTVTLAEKPKQ